MWLSSTLSSTEILDIIKKRSYNITGGIVAIVPQVAAQAASYC